MNKHVRGSVRRLVAAANDLRGKPSVHELRLQARPESIVIGLAEFVKQFSPVDMNAANGDTMALHRDMTMPEIKYDDQPFRFNGMQGIHQATGQVVFQYACEFDITRIWVDAKGKYVCEE